MIPSHAAIFMLDRNHVSPSFRLGAHLNPDDQIAHRLEQDLLDDMAPITGDRARILLANLDKLAMHPAARARGPLCVLNRARNLPVLMKFAKELADWVRYTLQSISGADDTTLRSILACRGITIGPHGRDALGRTTFMLYTPYGRITLD